VEVNCPSELDIEEKLRYPKGGNTLEEECKVVAKKHAGECMHEEFEDATCCNPDKDADEENMKKRF
jgi:hypothetical protein